MISLRISKRLALVLIIFIVAQIAVFKYYYSENRQNRKKSAVRVVVEQIQTDNQNLTETQVELLQHHIGRTDPYKLQGNELLVCDGGARTLPLSSVNDDYCDCEDHSDEPATSACYRVSYMCNSSIPV